MKSALIAGGLLAFALSFDEIIVTNFTIGAGEQTLPIWIYSNLFRPHELPIVNAVAVIVILISIIPVYLAHRLGGDEGGPTAGRGAAGGGIETEATAVPCTLRRLWWWICSTASASRPWWCSWESCWLRQSPPGRS